MANVGFVKGSFSPEEYVSKLFYQVFSATEEYNTNQQRFMDYKTYESQLTNSARRMERGESNYQERIDVAFKIRELENHIAIVYDRFILASARLARALKRYHPNVESFNFMGSTWKFSLTKLPACDIFFLRSNGLVERNQKSVALIVPTEKNESAQRIEDLRS